LSKAKICDARAVTADEAEFPVQVQMKAFGAGRGKPAAFFSILGMHASAISPRNPREFCWKSSALQSEGAGNAGRPMRPIAACAMVVVERTRVSQVTPESPGIPAQWF
jgi:hypothetical protein